MRVFIGLNVSLARTAVCFVDHDGAVQWQGKVPSEPGPLIKRLAESHGMIELAGIEARPLSEWLRLGPREAGIPIVCVETRHAQRFLSSRPVKTDKNDACGIAEMMRLGHYRPVHVKSPAAQSMRTPLAARMQLVAGRIDWHDLASDEPIEQVTDRGEPLLDARCRELMPAGLDPGADVLRLDSADRRHAGARAPP